MNRREEKKERKNQNPKLDRQVKHLNTILGFSRFSLENRSALFFDRSHNCKIFLGFTGFTRWTGERQTEGKSQTKLHTRVTHLWQNYSWTYPFTRSLFPPCLLQGCEFLCLHPSNPHTLTRSLLLPLFITRLWVFLSAYSPINHRSHSTSSLQKHEQLWRDFQEPSALPLHQIRTTFLEECCHWKEPSPQIRLWMWIVFLLPPGCYGSPEPTLLSSPRFSRYFKGNDSDINGPCEPLWTLQTR